MTGRDSSQDRVSAVLPNKLRNDRLDFLNIYKKLPWAVGVFLVDLILLLFIF